MKNAIVPVTIKPPSRCLDCGVKFIEENEMKSWFDCSECGAVHVQWNGKWWLEDDAIDGGMERERQLLSEIKNG